MTKPVEESAASETLKPQNKSQMLGAALAKLAGLGIEDLSHFLNDSLAQIGHEADAIPGGASNSNQATLNMKPSAAVKESVSADLSAIFGEGEDLSEEVKSQITGLFEAAVDAQVIFEREALIEEMNASLEEAYTAIQEEMTDKLDAYLDHVVENWLTENEVAIESALRIEVMEDFIDGMKNLFASHYMELPEEKVNVVEELAAKIEKLEAQIDETLTENISLKNEVLESKKKDVIDNVCEGLVLTQADKLRTLCENVEFDGDLKAFASRVEMLKEGLTKTAPEAPKTGILTEESNLDESQDTAPKALAPDVRRYAEAISRSIRK